MDIYTSSILISIVIYALIGNYAGRKVKHLEDYFVVGRQAPTLLIVGTLVASVLSTNAFLGETGFSYATQGGAFILWPSIWVGVALADSGRIDEAIPYLVRAQKQDDRWARLLPRLPASELLPDDPKLIRRLVEQMQRE